MSSGAPSGARSNGVPVTSWWAALGHCDPRATEEALSRLADAGIAAYAQPDGGGLGAYLEIHPPNRPLDLIYVEGNRKHEANELVGSQLEGRFTKDAGSGPENTSGPHGSLDDEDAAFAAIVAGFHDVPPANTWPTSEDAAALSETAPDIPPTTYQRTIRGAEANPPGLLDPGGLLGDEIRRPGEDPFAGDDEHFIPPALGKAPPIQALTRLAIAAIIVGIAFVVSPAFWGFDDQAVAGTLGVALIVAGTVRLLGNLRDDPPDDHPEDGAVV